MRLPCAGGGGTISGGGPYRQGEVALVAAMPNTGYRVKSWTGSDDDGSTANSNVVTMISDKTVTVEFELIPSGDGLVAHFPFDGDVQEVTGYSNDGVNYGSTDTEDRFGEPNSARHFTDRQYVRVPRSAAIEPADAITVALWARLTDPNARELPILSKRYNVDSPLCNSYILQPNNAPDFNMVGAIIAGGSVVPAASSTAMEPYVWTHEALVYNGASLKVYQDGQLVAQCPATGDLDYSSDDLYIGIATPARLGQHWEGDIDDVRIYSRALSAGEVWELSGQTLDMGGTVCTDPANPLTSGLAGVTVAVTGDHGVYEAITSGAAGVWRISDVNEGTYTVVPGKAGWEFEHIASGVPDGQSSIVIEVNEADQLDDRSIEFLAEEVGVRLHDWNGDGIVSIVGDVPPFVRCVYFNDCPDDMDTIVLGDCNHDGILSIVGDVPCFVECVYFRNCPE
ncbi:MAG: LamG-like jellyroll fold domain-containing protein [Phycisphaerales bacterium]